MGRTGGTCRLGTGWGGVPRPLRALRRCARAVVALEFAMLGPFALVIILVGIAAARFYLIDACLHGALLDAARYGGTGADAYDGLRYANIQGRLTNWVGVTPTLSMTAFTSWDNLAANTGGVVNSPGAPGNIVIYTVTYTDPLLSQFLKLLPLLPGSRNPAQASPATIVESTVIQNEPNFSS
jgi:hypothetical protein